MIRTNRYKKTGLVNTVLMLSLGYAVAIPVGCTDITPEEARTMISKSDDSEVIINPFPILDKLKFPPWITPVGITNEGKYPRNLKIIHLIQALHKARDKQADNTKGFVIYTAVSANSSNLTLGGGGYYDKETDVEVRICLILSTDKPADQLVIVESDYFENNDSKTNAEKGGIQRRELFSVSNGCNVRTINKKGLFCR